MTALDKIVLLISADAAFTERVLAGLSPRRPAGENSTSPRGHYQVWMASSLAQARERLAPARAAEKRPNPVAIVLDDSAFEESAGKAQAEAQQAKGAGPISATRVARHQKMAAAVFELAEFGPVIVIAAPDRLGELSPATELIAAGGVDCVTRSGDYLSLVLALVERHAVSARVPAPSPYGAGTRAEEVAAREAFGEVLRHEVNNPLTGILGNAELLLARRERLSALAIQRLETIAELAVRLRETVRRLSYSFENGCVAEADVPSPESDSAASNFPTVIR